MSVTKLYLNNQLNIKCAGYQHAHCSNLSSSIKKYCDGGGILDNIFILKFMTIITSTSYYSSCHLRVTTWLPAVLSMVKNTDPCINSQLLIILGNHHVVDLFRQLITRGVKIDITVLNAAISKGAFHLAAFLVNHIVATSETLELICKSIACPLEEYNKIITNIINQKIKITSKCLANAISLKRTTAVDLLIQYGATVDQIVLSSACVLQDSALISRILQCKIVPTKESFDSLFKSVYLGYSGRLQNTKADGGYTNNVHISILIDVLTNAGYVVTYPDVITAMKSRCYINDIKRFNLTFKDHFFVECSKVGYYPYDAYELGISLTMECLYVECEKQSNLVQIKKLIAQGLTPDVECLRRASSNRYNITVMNYLINTYKLIPDIQCIRNTATYVYNDNLNLILKNFKEGRVSAPANPTLKAVCTLPIVKATKESVKPVVKIPSTKIAKKKVVVKQLTNKEIAARKKIDKKVEDKKKKMEEKAKANLKDKKKKKKPTTELDELANELELSDEFKEFEINKDKDKEEEEEDEEEELVEEDEEDDGGVEMSLKIPTKVPKNKRVKMKISKDILEFLKLKKETTMSFFELRKSITDYVMKHKLCKKEDIFINDNDSEEKTIIRPNRSMCTVLGLKNNNYISVNKLDDLVSQCYK